MKAWNTTGALGLVIFFITGCQSDAILPDAVSGSVPEATAFTFEKVTTTEIWAGSYDGYLDATGTNAQFFRPYDIDADLQGTIYIADTENHRIRKISPEGEVTTFAGSTQGFADGNGGTARFNYPTGLDVDALGNVFVADNGNHRIRKISPKGIVTTISGNKLGYQDGSSQFARFSFPEDLAVDGEGNIYVTDQHRIRKLTLTDPKLGSYTVSTLAGGSSSGFADGPSSSARFNFPIGITIGPSGSVYIADTGNHRIRVMPPSGATVSTLAGTGPGYADGDASNAQFRRPLNLAFRESALYVADSDNHKIRLIMDGQVSTLDTQPSTHIAETEPPSIGDNPNFYEFYLCHPTGVYPDPDGAVYVSAYCNSRIWRILP